MSAGTLLVNQFNPHGAYGYGLTNFDEMTAALDNAFGGSSNITVSSAPLGDASAFDALWITARASGDPGLSVAELANLTAFIATGKRVVILGENFSWTDWNQSFLGILGGSYAGGMTGNESLTPALVHPVTSGMTSVQVGDDGIAIGGTSLFSTNVVTLWGAQQNVITVLSLNMLDDLSSGGHPQNEIFKTNLANWLASPNADVPEPGSFSLAGLALAALCWSARKGRMP